MANQLLAPQIITEALRVLHNYLNFVGNIERQYDSRFAVSGAKIGAQLQIRLPNQYQVRTGNVAVVQNTLEQSVVLTLATMKGVDLVFESAELTLTIDKFMDRYIKPAMTMLAANIESDAFNMYKDVFNFVGTPGATPNALVTFLNAQKLLNKFLTPDDNQRHLNVNSEIMAAMVDAAKALFNPSSNISKQYKNGFFTDLASFKWWRSEIIPTHTNGLQAGTPVVNGAAQTGTSLVTNGWTANTTIKRGTVLTIGSGTAVNAVHPETRQAYGFAQQFVVTADVQADGGGNATLPISPPIVTTGAYQTVTASPDNGATVSLATGSASTGYPQAMGYHKEAFAFVTADLEQPKGMDMAARITQDGLSLAFIRGFDITNRQFISRMDILYGYQTIRPQLAVRITT